MIDNYIGKRGYSIKKKNLTQTELYKLRSDLTAKPNIGGNGYSSSISYPIYRESENKIYIPRYYGIQKYGNVNKINIAEGTNINVEFKGSLYDYQTNIINKTLTHFKNNGGGLLDVEPGKGKTVMALNIISKLKKKTLVIVHKTFLMNQWKERISYFLPNAKIGYIQGKIVDTEDKDIVIGMLQTLSTKELPAEIKNDFGFTIYDECHHLGAEVFSLVMIQINTNYNLGLSGTMTRKDGLTKVFKWFIGPIIHKEKSDLTQEVLIKTINFEDPTNEKYNQVDTDYRGNPMYSRMISNLCNNENRTSMIINIIKHELKDIENVKQIMILAHNKSLINNIHNELISFEPSVGLYLGGMKENELKSSENKKVIIATYAMASEGLDIKTLTTLFMVTPKTDVCQSVGRILRTNHSRPLVIDIIDAHDIFKKQYNKRKKYYNKKNYIIKNYKNLTSYLDNSETIKHNNQSQKKCLIEL